MNISNKITSFLKKESPIIFGITGSIGVVITVIFAVKATPKAVELIQKKSREIHDGDPYACTKTEAIQASWKCYIPTVIAGALTIGCVFASSFLSKKQYLSMASSYAIIRKLHSDYVDKVKEVCGPDIHEKIMKELAVEKAKDQHIEAPWFAGSASLDFEDAEEEPRLFYDSFSERYFESTISKVLQAEYHLNRNFVLGMTMTLNDYYDFLGLAKIEGGDNIGWEINDEYYWLDFNHYKTTVEDTVADPLECWVIEMVFEPTENIFV